MDGRNLGIALAYEGIKDSLGVRIRIKVRPIWLAAGESGLGLF